MAKTADQNPAHLGGPSFNPALDNITFPASREALIKHFEGSDIDDDFRSRLSKLDDRTYNDRDDFRVAFGEDLDNYASVKKTDDTAVEKNPTSR